MINKKDKTKTGGWGKKKKKKTIGGVSATALPCVPRTKKSRTVQIKHKYVTARIRKHISAQKTV